MSDSTISRRELIRRGGVLGSLLALPSVLRGATQGAAKTVSTAATAGLRAGQNVYQSIGVRPLINARGTFTIISGSTMLPEVREAMDAAARQYVHLDELAEAVGGRLAELTKAEWGLVTNGCSAGLTLATAACVAGGNPDLHVRLPNLSGFPKDEAVIPANSRNVYDAALRAVGVRVVEVSTMAEFEAALGPRTAAWSRCAQASRAAIAPAMLSLPTFMPRPMPQFCRNAARTRSLRPSSRPAV